MQTVAIAIGAFVLYLVAYHTYGRYLSRRIFQIDPARRAPAEEFEDNIDFVPSRRELVFGHHFTSIAGTGPIVGPAVAVIWGWVPALVWVLVGSIVMGAVHDFGSLVISMRHQGRTIADLAGDVVTPRVRILFLLVVTVGLWIVLAVFGLVIAVIFNLYPSSVAPVFLQIPIAIAFGIWVRRGGSLILGAVVSVLLMYATIVATANFEWAQITLGPSITSWISPVGFWTLILLVYVFIASVLPVHTLLQPRDFINSWQLLIAMGLLLISLIVSHPPIVADAVNFKPAPATPGAHVPSFMPFLFVTIACGAISGFHCLVASGCSSRQLRTEADAQYVGYGAMLTEGFLATLVILACAAGIGLGTVVNLPGLPVMAVDGLLRSTTGSVPPDAMLLLGRDAWEHHYATWGGDAGLGNMLAPFVTGAANMIESIGISHALAIAIMGVFVASFAATTMDSACRLQRYVIAELAGAGRLTSDQVCAACGYSRTGLAHDHPCPECGDAHSHHRRAKPRNIVAAFFGNRYGATTIAVLTAGMLALSDGVQKKTTYGPVSFQMPTGTFSAQSMTLQGERMTAQNATIQRNGVQGSAGTYQATNPGAEFRSQLPAPTGTSYFVDFTNAGKGGLTLWPVFGATNQLLGGLALLVLTVWLVRTGRPPWVTAIPMLFMLAMTGWAIADMIAGFAHAPGKLHLLVVTILMLALEIWIVLEAVVLIVRRPTHPASEALGT